MEFITVSDKCYVRNSMIPFDEDDTHEFKGHRNIAVEELPPFTQATKNRPCTRRAVSRVINAFLNSGKGGTVFLGVTDDKKVCGLPMSHHQKEHLLESLEDLMSRYQYPVKLHRIRVQFVPVVEKFDTEEQIAKQMAFVKKPPGQRSTTMPHQLRTHKPCWCDNECLARNTMGVMSMSYVVEIIVSAWDPDDMRNTDGVGKYNILPLCENEEGICYLRDGVSLAKCTPQEALRMLRSNIDKRAEEELERIEREVAELEEEMRIKGIPLTD